MRMMTVTFAAIALSACTAPPPSPGDAAKAHVAASLKDPSSAEFRSIETFRFFGGDMVCGDVNGRNSFGAFAGYRTFSIVRSPSGEWQPPEIADVGSESHLQRGTCNYWREYVKEHGLAERMPSPAEQEKLSSDYREWVVAEAAKAIHQGR